MTRELLRRIEQKLDKFEALLPDNHVTVNEVKNLKYLWDSSLKDIKPKGVWQPKPGKYLPPRVMGLDGKFVYADELIKKVSPNFAQDSSAVPMGNNILGGLDFEQLNQRLIDSWFLGYGELSLLTQNSLLQRFCSVMAEEMCRKWIEFVGVSGNIEESKIRELEDEFDRLNVRDKIYWALYLTFVFGGCMITPKLKDDEDIQDSELFIDEQTIGIGDLEYIQTIEPTWYVPISYNTTEPRSQWFYEPEIYTVLNTMTHSSRLFKITYAANVNLIKPIYLFNGQGLMSQLISWVTKFENTYNNVISIINRFNLSVLKVGMSALVDDSSINGYETAASSFKNRIDVFNTFRNNMSTLALANDEEFEQVQMSLSGLDQLLTKSLEYTVIPMGMPIVKAFGNSPGGMNSSGEFEMTMWYDRISALQESMARSALTKIMHLAMLNIWGKIDKNITFNFIKLEETNPLEDAQIRQLNSQADSTYIASGILASSEVRERLASDPDSGYNNLDLSDEIANEISEATMKPNDSEDDSEDEDIL